MVSPGLQSDPGIALVRRCATSQCRAEGCAVQRRAWVAVLSCGARLDCAGPSAESSGQTRFKWPGWGEPGDESDLPRVADRSTPLLLGKCFIPQADFAMAIITIVVSPSVMEALVVQVGSKRA